MAKSNPQKRKFLSRESQEIIKRNPKNQKFDKNQEGIVKGKIVLRHSKQPLENLTVKVYDKNLGTEKEIGQAISNEKGEYQVNYTNEQLGVKNTANLIVKVYEQDKRESLLYTSPLILNAHPEENIPIELEAEDEKEGEIQNSEFSMIRSMLQESDLPENKWDSIETDHDIAILANTSGLEEIKIRNFLSARREAKNSSVSEEVHFGLLSSEFNLTLEEVFDTNNSGLREVFYHEIEKGTIGLDPARVDEAVNQTIAHILEVELAKINDNPNEGKLAVMSLGLPDGDKKKREFLLVHGAAFMQGGAKVLQGLVDNDTLAQAKKMEYALAIGEVVQMNKPLVEKLMNHNGVKVPRDLAFLQSGDWATLIENEYLPESIPGKSPGEKRRHYAKEILNKLEKKFPTARLAGHQEEFDKENNKQFVDFVRKTEFDLEKQPIRKFFARNTNIKKRSDAFMLELKVRRNLIRLIPSVSSDRVVVFQAMWQLQMRSVSQIIRTGQSEFRKLMHGKLDGGGEFTTIADQVFNKALQLSGMALFTQAKFHDSMHGPDVRILNDYRTTPNIEKVQQEIKNINKNEPEQNLVNTNPVASQVQSLPAEDLAEFQKLFGSEDHCACKHCQSVYSPSAYLVDLLTYLNNIRLCENPGTPECESAIERREVLTAKDLLLKRRPDLLVLDLTCENSHTTLPYIDLVVEILESVVIEGFDLDHQGTELSSKHLQTTLSKDELSAMPEHIYPEVYEKLYRHGSTPIIYPWNCPFDLWWEESSIYLKHLKSPRYRLMEDFHLKESPADVITVAAEYLGLNRLAFNTLRKRNHTDQLYGYFDNMELSNQLENVIDDHIRVATNHIDRILAFVKDKRNKTPDRKPFTQFIKWMKATEIEYNDIKTSIRKLSLTADNHRFQIKKFSNQINKAKSKLFKKDPKLLNVLDQLEKLGTPKNELKKMERAFGTIKSHLTKINNKIQKIDEGIWDSEDYQKAKSIPEFLAKTQLAADPQEQYDVLRDMLQSYYVNPSQSETSSLRNVAIKFENETDCQLATAKFFVQSDDCNFSFETFLIRFFEFWKLRQATNWRIHELDKVLYALKKNDCLDINMDEALPFCAYVNRIREDTKISVTEILSWWQGLDVAGLHAARSKEMYRSYRDLKKNQRIPSLYETLFINQTIDNPELNGVFDLDETGTKLKSISAADLIKRKLMSKSGDQINFDVVNFAPILAAFRITSDELKALLLHYYQDKVTAEGWYFNLQTLSELHAAVSFCRHLKLKIPEFISLLDITGVDFIGTKASPESTYKFIQEVLGKLRKQGFSIPELSYLLMHRRILRFSDFPEEQRITTFLEELRKEINEGLKVIDPEEHGSEGSLWINLELALDKSNIRMLQQITNGTIPYDKLKYAIRSQAIKEGYDDPDTNASQLAEALASLQKELIKEKTASSLKLTHQNILKYSTDDSFKSKDVKEVFSLLADPGNEPITEENVSNLFRGFVATMEKHAPFNSNYFQIFHSHLQTILTEDARITNLLIGKVMKMLDHVAPLLDAQKNFIRWHFASLGLDSERFIELLEGDQVLPLLNPDIHNYPQIRRYWTLLLCSGYAVEEIELNSDDIRKITLNHFANLAKHKSNWYGGICEDLIRQLSEYVLVAKSPDFNKNKLKRVLEYTFSIPVENVENIITSDSPVDEILRAFLPEPDHVITYYDSLTTPHEIDDSTWKKKILSKKIAYLKQALLDKGNLEITWQSKLTIDIIRMLVLNHASEENTYEKHLIQDFLGLMINHEALEATLLEDEEIRADINARMKFLLHFFISSNIIIQKFSEELQLEPGTTTLLLNKFLTNNNLPGSPKIILNFQNQKAFLLPQEALNKYHYAEQYDAYIKVHKVGWLLNKLESNEEVVRFIFEYKGNEASTRYDLNHVPTKKITLGNKNPQFATEYFERFLRLLTTIQLNKKHFTNQQSLYSFLGFADYQITNSSEPASAKNRINTIFKELAEITGWEEEEITLACRDILNIYSDKELNPDQLKDDHWLAKLAKIMEWQFRLGASVKQIASWTKGKVELAHAMQIRRTVKAKYGIERWLEVAPPLRDELRRKQRSALQEYLIAQHEQFKNPGDLYDYYLVDTEMDACMSTSRTKLAISSAQLFMQRLMLGLETIKKETGEQTTVAISNQDLMDQWKWRKNYRVWEANRKVFLYPENWIEPELRIDKTPFFSDLENELLQDELTDQTIERAYLNYLDKLDEVARLEVMAMYHDEEQGELHVVGRTFSEPHKYFYRKWVNETYWTPWEMVDLDIEGDHVLLTKWNGRIHLIWALFIKKSKQIKLKDKDGNVTHFNLRYVYSEYKNGFWNKKKMLRQSFELEFYPIELDLSTNYSESYNYEEVKDKLSLMKTNDFYITTDFDNKFRHLLDINTFVSIKAIFPFLKAGLMWRNTNFTEFNDLANHENSGQKLEYDFKVIKDSIRSGQFFKCSKNLKFQSDSGDILSSFNGKVLLPTQYSTIDHWSMNESNNGLTLRNSRPHFFAFDHKHVLLIKRINEQGYSLNTFFHPFVTPLKFAHLKRNALEINQPNQSFKYQGTDISFHRQLIQNSFLDSYRPGSIIEGILPKKNFSFEARDAYSEYNWELFFHIPFLVANRLSQDQRFEQAQHWYHYIFNPTTPEDAGENKGHKRFWHIKPFYTYDQERHIKEFLDLFEGVDSDEESQLRKEDFLKQIAMWQQHPFQPHKIASLRNVAYMRVVVMKYLDNLIAWGDQLFRRFSIESVNEATQLYMLAASILGKKPVKLEALDQQTQNAGDAFDRVQSLYAEDLIETMHAIDEAFPELEDVTMLDSIFGSGFCIPNNEKLSGYWDLVADRLFKIRHCMDIEGQVIKMPLFEPPIDPAMLVRAVAAGVDFNSALNDLYTPLPHYRFSYVLQKAIEFCNEVKSLGGSLLSSLEKKDGEEMALLRAKQEIETLQSAKENRRQAIKEAEESLAASNTSKKSAETRQKYYSGKKFMNAAEITAQSLLLTSSIMQGVGQGIKAVAPVVRNIPEVTVGGAGSVGSPVNIAKIAGGDKLAESAISAGDIFLIISSILSTGSSMANTIAGYQRRKEDWDNQAALAKIEIEQIEKQIIAAEIRLSMAENELNNHEKQIEQSQEVARFMKDKFTNKELYNWMTGQTSTLYFQMYNMAYDMAKKAEKAYQHELGVSDSFIEFGYWDSRKKGLLAGSKLLNALRRMETAYLEKNKREYELTRNIPLSLLDAQALMHLKKDGYCYFSIPELLFDADHPSHYFRRIKSVSISIPCVTGPYTNVSATLTLMDNRIRKNTRIQDGYAYQGINDMRFIHNIMGGQSIATSTGQHDGGLFEFNFRDERYLPFEKAGAASSWRLELPQKFRSFDYTSITDVIIHLNYTAREGGALFKSNVETNLDESINKWLDEVAEEGKGLYRAFSLKNDFPDMLHKMNSGSETELKISLKKNHFPFLFQNGDRSINEQFELSNIYKIEQDSTKIEDTGDIQIAFESPENDENLKDLKIFEIPDDAKFHDLIFVVKYFLN